MQKKVIAITNGTRLNKLGVNVCTLRNVIIDLKTAKTVTEFRKILSKEKLCFNSTGAKYRIAEFRSAKNCLKCRNKHHTSICDKLGDSKSKPMLVTTETNVTYPVVMIPVICVKLHFLTQAQVSGT